MTLITISLIHAINLTAQTNFDKLCSVIYNFEPFLDSIENIRPCVDYLYELVCGTMRMKKLTDFQDDLSISSKEEAISSEEVSIVTEKFLSAVVSSYIHSKFKKYENRIEAALGKNFGFFEKILVIPCFVFISRQVETYKSHSLFRPVNGNTY